MLRTRLSKFGMATAGVAVGGIMAISPVFAQDTTSTTTSNSNTLLADILKAAEAAGLTAEQTKELLEVAGEFIAQAPETDEDVDEDQDEDADETAEVSGAEATKETKKTVTITFTVPKSSEESKGGDD